MCSSPLIVSNCVFRLGRLITLEVCKYKISIVFTFADICKKCTSIAWRLSVIDGFIDLFVCISRSLLAELQERS